MMKYNAEFDQNNKPTFTYYRERLLRRKDNFYWEGFIHEVMASLEVRCFIVILQLHIVR